MKIAVGADHLGYPLKESVKAHLTGLGHEVVDFGVDDATPVDYPDVAVVVAREVAGYSVASVARHFHREASTLVRGVLKFEREIEANRRWRREAETLVANLRRS